MTSREAWFTNDKHTICPEEQKINALFKDALRTAFLQKVLDHISAFFLHLMNMHKTAKLCSRETCVCRHGKCVFHERIARAWTNYIRLSKTHVQRCTLFKRRLDVRRVFHSFFKTNE